MADNVTVDNGALTDVEVATDKVTYSGDADRDVQLLRQVHVAGAEGAKTVEPVTGTIGAATPVAAVVLGGHDGTNLQAIKVDTAGEAQVDVLTVPAPLSTTGGGTEATALRVTLASDSTGVVSVDDNGASLTIDGTVDLAAGTAYVGRVRLTDGTSDLVVDTAHGDAESNTENHLDIAAKLMGFNGTTWDRLRSDTTNGLDVDVVRLPASTNTLEVVGDVAQDAAAAGNPVLIGASHETAADSAPANRVSADGDATRLSAMDGALYVIPGGPQQWKARLTGTMTDTTVKAAPGAGLSLYIQTIVYSIGAATASSILLEESTTTPVFGPHYLENVSGRGVAVTFNPPIKITANTLLSATNTGSTTATLDVYGFTALG